MEKIHAPAKEEPVGIIESISSSVLPKREEKLQSTLSEKLGTASVAQDEGPVRETASLVHHLNNEISQMSGFSRFTLASLACLILAAVVGGSYLLVKAVR